MTGKEVMCSSRSYESGVEGGMVRISEMRALDDDQAIIAMTDSNFHREHIKPSEKAFAYKMRLEAIKHQGKKNMMTSAQVEPKCNEPQA